MKTDKAAVSEGNGAGMRVEPSTASQIGVSNHVVKVIEVLAESSHSWEDAVRIALREASHSIRNISSIYIKDMQAVVRDGHVAAWRVDTKVSFVVMDRHTSEANAETRQLTSTTGEENMRHRNPDQGREGERRPYRNERDVFPEYDEYGLHGDERREYRGRESYEQQTRGGHGGRSGMWDQRFVPRDLDAPYRNNSDEDRRGYQNVGSRQEFESGSQRHGYPRPRPYDEDDARYGFDSRDYGEREWMSRDSGRSRNRDSGNVDRWESNRLANDDYSRSDYGRGYRNRGEYGAPYSERANYNSSYDEPRPSYGHGEIQRHYGYGSAASRSERNWPAQSYDQGRLASAEYGRAQFQRRTGQGPKGYRRSDERIREDVCDRLSQDWELDASEVEVTVSSGEVTLTGSVADRDQKFRIEHIADSVGGVSEVHNQLRIQRDQRDLPSQGATAASPTKTTPTSHNRSS